MLVNLQPRTLNIMIMSKQNYLQSNLKTLSENECRNTTGGHPIVVRKLFQALLRGAMGAGGSTIQEDEITEKEMKAMAGQSA